MTGKFWLKSGSVITETVDFGAENITDEDAMEGIAKINRLAADSFKTSASRSAILFGPLVIRIDDCSALSFKEVVSK